MTLTPHQLARLGRGQVDLSELGSELRNRGLTPDATCSALGISHVSALSWCAASPLPDPRHAVAHLFSGGARVPLDETRNAIGDLWTTLLSLNLVEEIDGFASSTLTIIPVGRGLVACDRRDERSSDAVCIPDDSAYHLLGCLPKVAPRWLDVGTGCGVLLVAGKVAVEELVATDIHRRSLAFADLSCGLSGVSVCLKQSNLLDEISDSFDLITFNAPLPPGAVARQSAYYHATEKLGDRFWRQAAGALADSGEVLLHTLIGDSAPPPGRCSVAIYTPADFPQQFGVCRWQNRPVQPVTTQRVELGRGLAHLRRSDLA